MDKEEKSTIYVICNGATSSDVINDQSPAGWDDAPSRVIKRGSVYAHGFSGPSKTLDEMTAHLHYYYTDLLESGKIVSYKISDVPRE